MEVEFISNAYQVGSQRVIQCNIRDVSERKRLEHLKDAFLSTVSHEIRTPLSILKVGIENLEILRAGKCEKDEGAIIEALKRNSERLGRLIIDLLDLSRFESGRMGTAKLEVQIGSLIEEVLQGFQKTAKERCLALTRDEDKDLPKLMADPDLLVRVLTNLLDNAVRFAKSKILVTARTNGSSLQVGISNDGPVINAKDMPSLFDKFVQIDRPPGGNGYKGTGLGLAICNEIINLHGGKIWAESLEDRGCQFHFTIPLKNEAPA
jgi:signal transduction histidine kinase